MTKLLPQLTALPDNQTSFTVSPDKLGLSHPRNLLSSNQAG